MFLPCLTCSYEVPYSLDHKFLFLGVFDMSNKTDTNLVLVATDHGWDLVEHQVFPLVDRLDTPSGLVRVQIARASLSNTQAQIMSRQRSATSGRVLGHEAFGWVSEVSPLAQRWLDEQDRALSVGDLVVIFPYRPCLGVDEGGAPLECHACNFGRVEECSRLRAVGVEEDGVLANFCDFPPQMIHSVPDSMANADLSWTTLLYVETVSQALVAAQSDAVSGARHICVVGRGPVQELTARVIESVRFGWKFTSALSSLSETFDRQMLYAVLPSQDNEDTVHYVHRLDPSSLPRHPRAFDVIVETWADPASLSDMFHALKPQGVLIRKSRPGRAVSLLRQAAPLLPVRVVEAPYGAFSSALAWMAEHPGALRHLDVDLHKMLVQASTPPDPSIQRVPIPSPYLENNEGMGFPFTKGGIQAALEADRRRETIGKIFIEIAKTPPVGKGEV